MYRRYERARLFGAGVYAERGLTFTPNDIEEIAANSNLVGPIPINIEHAPTDQTIDMGYVVSGSLIADGEYLLGSLDIPEAALGILKARGLSIEYDRVDKVIVGLAITASPRMPSAAFSNAPDETPDSNVVELLTAGLELDEPSAPETPDDPPICIGDMVADNPPAEPITEMSVEPTPDPELIQLRAELRTRDIDKMTADYVGQGVPPAIASPLAGLAVDGDETVRMTAKSVLDAMIGSTPMRQQLPDVDAVPSPDEPEYVDYAIRQAREVAGGDRATYYNTLIELLRKGE